MQAVRVVSLPVPAMLFVLGSDWYAGRGVFYYKNSSYSDDRAKNPHCEALHQIVTGKGDAAPNGETEAERDADQKHHDSCQQWRSAQASERSAFYGGLQSLAAVLGMMFSLATVLIAVVAARYAKKAADHTEAGATAAHAAALHSAEMNEIAKADQRAWLDVTAKTTGLIVYPNRIRLTTVWRIKNIGKSPARDVRAHVTVIQVGNTIIPVIDRALVFFGEKVAAAVVVDPYSTTVLPNGEFDIPGMISDFEITIPGMLSEHATSLAVIYCAAYKSDAGQDVKVSGGVSLLALFGPFMPPFVGDHTEFPNDQRRCSDFTPGKKYT